MKKTFSLLFALIMFNTLSAQLPISEFNGSYELFKVSDDRQLNSVASEESIIELNDSTFSIIGSSENFIMPFEVIEFRRTNQYGARYIIGLLNDEDIPIKCYLSFYMGDLMWCDCTHPQGNFVYEHLTD